MHPYHAFFTLLMSHLPFTPKGLKLPFSSLGVGEDDGTDGRCCARAICNALLPEQYPVPDENQGYDFTGSSTLSGERPHASQRAILMLAACQ